MAYAVDAVSVLMILLAAAAVSPGGVQPVDTTHTGATNERKGALGERWEEHEQRRGVIDQFRAQEPRTDRQAVADSVARCGPALHIGGTPARRMPKWHAARTASQCEFCCLKRSLELCPFRRIKFRDDRRACDEDALPSGALAVSTTPYMMPTDVTQVRQPPRTFRYVRREEELLNDAESTPSEGD